MGLKKMNEMGVRKPSGKILFGIFITVLLLGISYALFSETLVGQKNYSITSGRLKIQLDESKSNHILLENAIPVSDDEGMKNSIYEFSLINEEKQDLAYTIYLKEEEYEKKTPSSAIKYYYTRDVDDVKIMRKLEEQRTEEGRYYLETGVIPAKNTYQYTFRMWIDYEAGNEILGTEYSIRLEVEVKQTIELYQEEILNGSDPVLSSNLVPVIIEENGEVKKASLFQEWYKYSEQRWANVVVLEDNTIEYNVGDRIPESNIESYFVWIPKYRYQLWDLGNYNSLTSLDNTKVHAIAIQFGLYDTNDSVEGECTSPKTSGGSGNCKVGDYMTHPAFQAFDSNGFWVGKFESGYRGANTAKEAEQNKNDFSKLIIKPNVYSWRNITVGNAFKASYDYLRSDESHMMKNTEWGAVAYLQHSNYGSRATVRVNNNNSLLTGYASVVEPTCGYNKEISIDCNLNGTDSSVTLPYNTSTGYTASTTGNITGIYDMSGGAWEYVMGYNVDATTVGGSSGLTGIYGDFLTASEWHPYYDRYSNSTTSDTTYNKRILGDATGEMGPFANVLNPDGVKRYQSSWYGDYGYTVKSLSPWFIRGGGWTGGILAGVFSSHVDTGGVHSGYSFRVVLTP